MRSQTFFSRKTTSHARDAKCAKKNKKDSRHAPREHLAEEERKRERKREREWSIPLPLHRTRDILFPFLLLFLCQSFIYEEMTFS